MGGNHTEQHDPADRFADDPAFAAHEGGKLKVRPTRPIRSIDDLALTYTPPGVARVSSAIAADPRWPTGSPGHRGWSWSSIVQWRLQ
jgi:malate dehydrogenase (oxaloacetate-decarboxylating)